ncbi:MAG TPA: protein translocase subunit SecF [Polyangia bacterium]|jgi:preprotein translocase subunit SecF|nr:protein translocase subunit SecF [Polyangia bacterium]
MSKFFEIIRPDHNFEFVGRQKLFLGISSFLVVLSFLMLPINAFLIKSRGLPLNYSIDFRGGTEMQIQFAAPQDSGKVRGALNAGGFKDPEVVKLNTAEHPNTYLVRFATVSPVSEEQAQKIEARMRSTLGNDAVRKFEFSEGGDKIYVRYTKAVETTQIAEMLKAEGVQNNTVQRFGRPEDNTYEIILVGLDTEVKRALESKMGEGAVAAIPSVESVGARAGKELRDDGIKSLLAAIMFILAYIAVRFDFRYGPGTVAALLHDAILVMGAFAVLYIDFSLVTIAAILTVIGYSMNDTIVVFDRIRENAARLRDKKFDRVVNSSINETLSRTILTSATVFFVTLAMNIWGTGSIREFGFAMNVGVIVGTYSSIFVAAPILIWLNDRFFKATGKPAKQAS